MSASPAVPAALSHPPLTTKPTTIGALSTELIEKIFKQCGDGHMQLVVRDALPSCDPIFDQVTYRNAAPLGIRLEYTFDTRALYSVCKFWKDVANHLWKDHIKSVAIQPSEQCNDALDIVVDLERILSVQERGRFNSISLDIHDRSFPVELLSTFPNLTHVNIYQSRWRERFYRLRRQQAYLFAAFENVLAEKDTLDLLGGCFDGELCDAACLSRYFVPAIVDQVNQTPITLTFTYVLTSLIGSLRDSLTFVFPCGAIAFKFEVTLQQKQAAIVIVKPTALLAKFFLSSSREETFDRSSDRFFNAHDVPICIYRQTSAVQQASSEADVTTDDLEELDDTEDAEELDDTEASDGEEVTLPEIDSITYDEDIIHTLVQTNDVAFVPSF